ncbi:MAG: tyrosine-type recombinase/integrase [Caldilineales bacterium]|nr:tyrosine-type recombinase/integrase [Caldilineales bacterium]
MTNQDMMQQFIADSMAFAPSSHSQRQYRYVLKGFGRFIGDKSLTAESVLAFYGQLREKGLADATVASHDRVLRAFFGHAVLNGWLAQNPMRSVRRPRRPNRLPKSGDMVTFRAMVAAALNSIITDTNGGRLLNFRDLTMLVWLADTGCRAAELADLREHDVDLNGRFALIRTGKGRKQRQVIFSSTTAQLTDSWLQQRCTLGDGGPYLFPSFSTKGENVGALTPSGVSQSLHRMAKKAGVSHRPHRAHAWRHFCATEHIRNGADLHSTALILGHASTDVTRGYLHLDIGDLRMVHDRSSPITGLLMTAL